MRIGNELKQAESLESPDSIWQLGFVRVDFGALQEWRPRTLEDRRVMELDGPRPPGSVEERVGESNRFEIDEARHGPPVNKDVYRCEVPVGEDCLAMGEKCRPLIDDQGERRALLII
jgi:hypothetical protein